MGIAFYPSTAHAQDDEVGICLDCHGDVDFWEEGIRSLYVDLDRFTLSVHGEAGLSCTFCHDDIAGEEDLPHAEDLSQVDCSGCHDQEGREFEKSVHARKSGASGITATCQDCHGDHYILPVDDTRSMVYRANLPLSCSKCHAGENIDPAELGGEFEGQAVRSYLGSVHGTALTEKGLIITALCVDCHGSHDITSASARGSLVGREKGPKTCGTCHTGIFMDYNDSVHGVALRRGNPDVPMCTDCHGEHTILPHNVEASTVYPTNIAVTCSHCHDDMKLNTRYGLPVNRFKTFMGTYHGIASQLGDLTTANCVSCHGIHNIKSSTDSESLTHPRNLPETCGKCHPGASQHFAAYKVHVEEVGKESLGAYLAEKFYIIFIPVLIGVFILFIGIELYGSMKRKREEKQS
jgi:nitrate/TMAO reductase-like tetraheme cytochrome c subunit